MASVRHLGLFPTDRPSQSPCWINDPQTIVEQGVNVDLQWFSPTFTNLATPQTLTALFWRVKTFRFTNNLNSYVIDASVTIQKATETPGVYDLVAPQNERDLILATGGLEWRASDGDEEIQYNQPYSGGGLYIRWDGSFTGPRFVQIHGYAGIFRDEEEPFFEQRTFDVKGGTLTQQVSSCGTAEFKFDDVSLVLPLNGTLQQPQGTFLAPDFSVTALVEAVKYWPYDPGDGGGPIYNSTTGTQLRPFPST
jgi:hypothetical protein